MGNDNDINFLDNNTPKSPQKIIKTPSHKKTQKPPKYSTASKTQPKSPSQYDMGRNNMHGSSLQPEPTLPSHENLKIVSPSSKPFIPSNPLLDTSPSPNKISHMSPKTLSYENPPIQQPNHFSPADKNTNPKSQSSSTSTFGPSVSPGFEQFIPSPLKAHRENRKLRKTQKKKEKPHSNPSSSNHTPTPQSVSGSLDCPL